MVNVHHQLFVLQVYIASLRRLALGTRLAARLRPLPAEDLAIRQQMQARLFRSRRLQAPAFGQATLRKLRVGQVASAIVALGPHIAEARRLA